MKTKMFGLFLVSALSSQVALADVNGLSCVVGSGFFTSAISFDNGDAHCRLGDSTFLRGTYSQSGRNVSVDCETVHFDFRQESQRTLVELSTGARWRCE
jgi:hypothetical protein